jgi:putative ABC transport system permease protein
MRPLLSFRMAWRHVRAQFASMLLSVAAVALGVALVVAVRSMNAGVLSGFLDTVDGLAGRASFSVEAGEGLTFAEDIADVVRAVPGVRIAAPLVRSVTYPDDGSGEMLTVHGVDLTHESEVRLYHSTDDADKIIPDPLLFLNTPDSIILGREFAERRSLHVGDTIPLVAPGGVQRFRIRGLLDPEGLSRTLRGRLVVMDLFAAERAFTADEQINQIDVVVDPTADLQQTKRAVEAAIPSGLSVLEPEFRKGVIRRTVGGFQAMLGAFSLLAVVAGFVICYSRLQAIITGRTWEAGLLRAIGVRRSAVFAELLKESLLLGMAGAALGIPLGLFIGRVGIPLVATTTAINFRLPVPHVEPTIRPDIVLTGIVVGILASVIAAVVPAIGLARTSPVAALTSRGRELRSSRGRVQWGLRLTLPLVVIACVARQAATRSAALGLATSGLIVVTAALWTMPFAALGATVLRSTWRRAFGPTGRFAIDQLRLHPARSALTIATLGLGIGTVLLFGILAWSFEQTLVRRLVASERSDMVVFSAFASGGYRSAPLAETLVAELQQIPGVAVVAGEQSKDIEFRGGVITLQACDRPCFEDRRIYDWPLDHNALENARQLVARGDAVLVTTSFARQYGTRPGDMIELPSPTGLVELHVAGVSSGAPESAVLISRERYRRSWNDSTIWTANVALHDAAAYADVERAISQQLGSKYRLTIRSTAELIDYFAGEVRQAFSLQYLLEAVTLLLIVIALGDALASGVVERTRELGMMRAVGLHRTQLFGVVMLEGAAIGVLGLAMATVVGLSLGVFWVEMQFPALVGWDLDLYFPFRFALGAIALTLFLGGAGSFLPALRAARLPIVEALRHE